MHNKSKTLNETNMFLIWTLLSRFSLSWRRLLHFTLLVRITKRSHQTKAQLPNHACHSLCSHRILSSWIHTKPDNWESVRYSLFSHDVTKNSNEGIIDSSEFLLSWGSTAPRHLYLYKFSVCERILGFAKEDAWIFRLLPDAAFSWRSGKLLRQGHPTTIFGKISVRKTIWDLEFSEHLL